MASIIIILIFLSFWHLIYESVLFPSILLRYRCEFFTLKDQLRKLKEIKEDAISSELFLYLNNIIDANINNLPYITLGLVRTIIRELKPIETCQLNEIKDIKDKIIRYNIVILLGNSGGWIPYILLLIITIIIHGLSK